MSERQRPGFWLGWFVPTLFAALSLAVFLTSRTHLIPDTDALYHLGHAFAYRENGVFFSPFPWATASAIGDIGGDLWYGFHLILLPITLFTSDPASAMPIAQGLVLVLGYFTLSFFFREVEVPGAWLWPMPVFAGHEYGPWRAMMTRPGAISLGLLLVVVVALVRGRPGVAGLAALLFGFIHLTLAWLVLVAVVGVSLFQWICREKISVAAIGASLVGLFVGAFARPNPLGTFTLLRIQLVDITELLRHKPPLRFGVEVTQPLDSGTFWMIAWPLGLLTLAAFGIGFYLWRDSEFARVRVTWVTCVVFSIGFLALTLIQSSRTIELWAATSVAAIALIWSPLFGKDLNLRWVAATIPVLIVGWNLHAGTNTILRFGRDPQALRPAAEWLKSNAEPGAVVFHPLWEDFPGLFAYNRTQRFIGGMDPVFQFRHDEEKYWIAHWMCEDRGVAEVATSREGFQGPTLPMAEALRTKFNAQYLVIPVPRLGSLSQHLNGQSDFEMVGVFGQSAIYRIRPASSAD